MKTLKEIQDLLKAHQAELRDKYRVRELGIFGSVVRGEQKRGSDVDILVDFDQAPDLLKFCEVEIYLEKILRQKVDLVRKPALRPELRDQILSEARYI